jgi:hypothetical protein
MKIQNLQYYSIEEKTSYNYPKWKKYIFILAWKQHCQLDQWRSFKYIFGRSKVKETTVCFTYKEFEEERKTEADLVDMGTRDHSLFH